jgi:probable biosynthetic protein (TIGR04098 family)
MLPVGMPLTGQNNLAEGPLLRQLGHIRWDHLSTVLETPTSRIVDERGQRVYATFFFIDMVFPTELRISDFVESDEIEVVSTLRRYETFLDGELYLFRKSWPDEKKTVPSTREEAQARGIPIVRMGNSFVVQFKGADWLKKAAPATPQMNRIPEMGVPEYFADLLDARMNGQFFAPPGDFSAITDGEVNVQYQPVPERDINGVGLLYFANYPVITDICERIALTRVLGDTDLTSELMARRTVVRRRGGYFGNAGVRDSLRVGVSAWARSGGNEKDGFDHHLVVSSRIHRASDGRLMYVTSAEKIISHREKDLYAAFTRRAGGSEEIAESSLHGDPRPVVEHLDTNEVVIRFAAECAWTQGDSVAFRVDTPNGATECRATVESVKDERTGVRVTLRIVAPSSASSLADYVDSAVLRQLYPLSSLKVTLR